MIFASVQSFKGIFDIVNLDDTATEFSHIPIKLKAATPAKTAVTETCDRCQITGHVGKVNKLGYPTPHFPFLF